MKNFLSKHLLVAAVAVGSCNLHADSSCGVKLGTCSTLTACTNPSACAKNNGGKTYNSLYPHWSPDDTMCHKSVGSCEEDKDSCGASIDFVGFFSKTGGSKKEKCGTTAGCGVNNSDLGVYFGLTGLSTFAINNGGASANLTPDGLQVGDDALVGDAVAPFTTSGFADAFANVLVTGVVGGTVNAGAGAAPAGEAVAAVLVDRGPGAINGLVTDVASAGTSVLEHLNANQNIGLSLDPVQKSWGVVVNYRQDLSKLYKGLYLKVSAPIMHVERNVNATVRTVASSAAAGAAAAVAGATATTNQMAANIQRYLGGESVSPAVVRTNPNFVPAGDVEHSSIARVPVDIETLQNATLRDSSATGIADLDCRVGYRFLESDWYDLDVHAGLTVPTGNHSKGVELFEAIVGNGGHFALGAGLGGGVHLWGDDKKDNSCFNVFAHAGLDYRYNFKAKERRTLGLKNMNGASQWVLLGKLDTNAPAAPAAPAATTATRPASFVPLANVSTMDVDVTPGSQVNFNLSLGTGWEGFTFDVGYHLFFREEEEVKQRCGTACPAFPSNLTIDPLQVRVLCGTFASTSSSIGTEGDAGAVLPAGGRTAPTVLTSSDLDIKTAQTPNILTNGVYASIGYQIKEWEYPVHVGVNGGYRWANNNNPNSWWVGGCVGLSF